MTDPTLAKRKWPRLHHELMVTLSSEAYGNFSGWSTSVSQGGCFVNTNIAAPVDDVRAVVAEPPPTSRPVAGLTLGPLREQSGPGWALSEAVPDPRPDPSQEVSRTWELPSADMVQSALPQGALAPGASASGFLYFEHAPAGTAPVSLTARLVDAHSGEPIGVVVVPLAPE